MKIVVDMLGGDLGISATKIGLEEFISHHKDVEIFAVGNEDILNSVKGIKVINATSNVKMDAHAMELFHDRESSMAKAFDTLIKEDGDAIVSTASTGALLTFASLKVKKLDNVDRAALISPIPTIKENKKTLLLDLGANNENKVDDLISFANMAKIYYKAVYNINPTLALLSNGKEEGKGSPLIQETFLKLKESKFPNFIGNIEASELLNGDVDIVITDGFTGNVALKAIEGTGNIVKLLLKDTFKKSLKNKLAYLLIKKDLKEKLNMLSSKPLGGAMFIGLKKVVVKAHGNSDAIAFNNALETAYKCVKSDLIKKIVEGVRHE